jgi:hypothetical protein
VHPALPGCGPGGRGFESRRSPLEVPANRHVAGVSTGVERADGVQTGSLSSATTSSAEADEDPPGLAGPRSRGGDEAELYERFNPRLIALVRGLVNTSPDIVEDACAFA